MKVQELTAAPGVEDVGTAEVEAPCTCVREPRRCRASSRRGDDACRLDRAGGGDVGEARSSSLLADYDPEAEVLIVSQPSWPFENGLAGVCAREDYLEVDEDEELGDGMEGRDVLLVAADQVRYGSPDAWDAARSR